MKYVFMMMIFVALATGGCHKTDEKININDGVKNDNLINNIVTRPVAYAFSALIGEGIQINQAQLKENETGFLELYIVGYNNSYAKKEFEYFVEWLDAEGLVLETKTSVWQRMSASSKSNFRFKVVAPRREAKDFRMNIRK